jgi:uncharacterized protein involved in exopolysaccharide biosynthesis
MNNENNLERTSEVETEVNIAKYLNFGLKNLKTIIWITLVMTFCAVGYALWQDKYYSAQLTMVEADSSNSGLSSFTNISESFGGLTSLIGGSGEDSQTQKALSILESRTFIEEFIQENNILTILLSEDWDHEAQLWKDGQKDLFDGYMVFRKILNIEKDKKN